jgi:hypothetical protein
MMNAQTRVCRCAGSGNCRRKPGFIAHKNDADIRVLAEGRDCRGYDDIQTTITAHSIERNRNVITHDVNG